MGIFGVLAQFYAHAVLLCLGGPFAVVRKGRERPDPWCSARYARRLTHIVSHLTASFWFEDGDLHASVESEVSERAGDSNSW